MVVNISVTVVADFYTSIIGWIMVDVGLNIVVHGSSIIANGFGTDDLGL